MLASTLALLCAAAAAATAAVVPAAPSPPCTGDEIPNCCSTGGESTNNKLKSNCTPAGNPATLAELTQACQPSGRKPACCAAKQSSPLDGILHSVLGGNMGETKCAFIPEAPKIN